MLDVDFARVVFTLEEESSSSTSNLIVVDLGEDVSKPISIALVKVSVAVGAVPTTFLQDSRSFCKIL